MALLAGVVLLGIIVGDSQGKFLGLFFGHALQINRETGEWKVVVDLGYEVDALVIDDIFAFNHAFYVHGNQVAKGQRAFDRLPGGRLEPQIFQNVVHLLVRYFHLLAFQPDGLELSQVHDGLKGDNCFERHGRHV